MVQIFDIDTTEKFSVSEYTEHVKSNVDLRDIGSIADSAWALRALANDRSFVMAGFHEQLKNYYDMDLSKGPYAPQSVMNTHGLGFSVRTNIWLPMSNENVFSKFERPLYSYDLAHDHNFSFLTVGYYGPGYETDVFQYDYRKTNGYHNEPVELTEQGRLRLTPGTVFLYEAGVDVHTQIPPESVSVSVNLIIDPLEESPTQQYFFDLEKHCLTYAAGDITSKRLFVIEMCKYINDENTIDVLVNIIKNHRCVRSKAYALKVLEELRPDEVDFFRTVAGVKAVALSKYPLVWDVGPEKEAL